MATFTTNQKAAIQAGAKKRARLVKIAEKATKSATSRPTYIYSPAGLGKTFTVNEAIKDTKVTHFNISGNVSMFAFGVQLATIAYLDQTSKRIVINIDDCDEILKNEANINILKNMLEGSRTYAYNKSMSSQMANMSDIQCDAINFFSSTEKLGFTVPVDRFVFVFTSNMQLPVDDEVIEAQEKGQSKAALMAHRNAIRSRCQTNDFRLEWNVQWGWIADVVMNTKVLKLTKKEKVILLDWMYNNWYEMTERSIRTAEKMATAMIDDPTAYVDDWEIDFLK